jgi:hypothetical protein
MEALLTHTVDIAGENSLIIRQKQSITNSVWKSMRTLENPWAHWHQTLESHCPLVCSSKGRVNVCI